jgi:2'-5' RNA ligase
MKKGIFFIAILPDVEIQAEVTRFKEWAAKNYRSAHALRSPPHITLFPPFRWRNSEVQNLEATLREFAAGEASFYLGLKDFDCFSPRVIFVDVMESRELKNLQSRLQKKLESDLDLKNKDTRPFHPHMTIAFKDLKRGVFPEAWSYFSAQKYERFFAVKDIALLRHNGELWEIKRQFPLGNTPR